MDDEQRENLKAPTSAPSVPKEILSARPAMTKIKPQMPDPAAEASKSVEPPQPTTEEIAERQDRIDYLKSLHAPDKKTGKGRKKWLITAVFILGLILVGAAAFMILKKPAAVKDSPATSNTNQPATAPDTTDNDQTADMKTYDSSNFNLSFKYPADWKINDTLNALTVISPKTQLTTASGSQKPAAVLITIRPKQTSLAEFKSGNATAVLDSKNVTYTEPATGQRGSTYISYLQYASTTTKGALDAMYITGNAGYVKGQFIPQADVIKVDPLITVTFVDCTTTCTPTSTPISIEASSWSSNPLNLTVETILKSLSIS